MSQENFRFLLRLVATATCFRDKTQTRRDIMSHRSGFPVCWSLGTESKFSSNYLELLQLLHIFAIKYRRYAVGTTLAYGPEALSAGWRYDIEGKIILLCYFRKLFLRNTWV